ncbi:MAG: cytochrome c oxidase subunit II [Inquilinaceae bacterium]
MLWWGMLAGATAIFLFVMILLWIGFRREPQPPREHLFLPGLGIAFPLAVLALLLAWGLWAGERLLPRATPETVRVEAVARQWAWTFRYEDLPGHRTDGVLHIPVGRPVDVAITSADVVHSFWVPRLAGKLDAIPGHVNLLRIEAAAPGSYAGLGAEFNGTGYMNHRFTVVAHDAEGWDGFLAGEDR